LEKETEHGRRGVLPPGHDWWTLWLCVGWGGRVQGSEAGEKAGALLFLRARGGRHRHELKEQKAAQAKSPITRDQGQRNDAHRVLLLLVVVVMLLLLFVYSN